MNYVILIVGSGKLAAELLNSLSSLVEAKVVPWAEPTVRPSGASIVVHAGSGRELDAVCAYCQASGKTLIELSTGTDIQSKALGFPVVVCPNTNVLMLKFMAMLSAGGRYFKGCEIDLIESHQAAKSSLPGTAVAIAKSLGISSESIVSIRSPDEQREFVKIPTEHLARHAYHKIEVNEDGCRITLETKVFGAAPYAEGLARIISAVRANKLECRQYNVMEFVENGWV